MSAEPSHSPPTRRGFNLAEILEHGDGWAHMLVATLLLLLAIGILLVSTNNFVHEITHLGSLDDFSQSGLNYLSELLLGVIILELLSTILTYIRARNLEATIKDFLIVGLISSVRKILLTGAQSSLAAQEAAKAAELAKQQADKLGPQAVAELAKHVAEKANGLEYINEAVGTVITIIGILLLIGGLLLLDRRKKAMNSASEELAD